MIEKIRRNILKLIYPLAKTYWFFTRPNTVGVVVIIINSKNRVLLVKHSYKPKWHVPGGGVSKGEHLEDAARREVFEETNLKIGELGILGIYRKFENFKNDTAIVFFTKDIEDESNLKIDQVEISEAEWFDIKDLPKDTKKHDKKRIQEYLAPGQKVYTNR